MTLLHSTAKVTSKGQITIPKKVREALGIQTGTILLFEKEDEKVFIHTTRTIRDYKGYLKGKTVEADFDLIRKTAKKAAAARVMKHG